MVGRDRSGSWVLRSGETTLLRQMYDALSPGDVVVADALFDNYFLACELRQRGIELVARV